MNAVAAAKLPTNHPAEASKVQGIWQEALARAHLAEQVVLAFLLQSEDDGPADALDLAPEDFTEGVHRRIFEELVSARDHGERLDPLLLAQRLPHSLIDGQASALAYCRRLAAQTEGLNNWRSFARIVKEHAVLRALSVHWQALERQMATPDTGNAHGILVEAANRIERCLDRLSDRTRTGLQSMGELTARAMSVIDEAQREDGEGPSARCVPTGYRGLDDLMIGLGRGDLIVLAGRPSMGKTSLALNIAEHVALDQGLPVAVFSLEMDGAQLALRGLASRSRVDTGRMMRRGMPDEHWQRIVEAAQLTEHRPYFVDSCSDASPGYMRRRLQRFARQQGDVGLIVVDYMQLMATDHTASREGRAAQVGEISRALKGIAKEFNAPVLALSQLNRALELRPDKRPIMSDLRESGAIEQDADAVLFVYRDDAYHSDSPEPGVAEIIVAKQRSGPVGTARLRFERELTRFHEDPH